jgi:hypothetical protein
MAFAQLLLSAGATLLLWALFKAVARINHRFKSPLHNMKGPKESHWFYGNVRDIWGTVGHFCYVVWPQVTH